MNAARREAPRNIDSLQARIRNLAQERDQPVRRIQRAVASTVVGQMLPDGVVKGGTAMKIRVGEAGSRYTPDFDASRSRTSPSTTTSSSYATGSLAAGTVSPEPSACSSRARSRTFPPTT